jgi:hypothetical protein
MGWLTSIYFENNLIIEFLMRMSRKKALMGSFFPDHGACRQLSWFLVPFVVHIIYDLRLLIFDFFLGMLGAPFGSAQGRLSVAMFHHSTTTCTFWMAL